VSLLRPSVEEAARAWAELVGANREQVLRLQERVDGADFWKDMAKVFRADPRRSDDRVLDALQALVQPGETWLDVGAGGGRFALPLALKVRRVIAVEPSDAMRGVLREGMTEHGIANIDVIEGRWEHVEAPVADVALIAHVGYDIDNIVPFLEKLERHARRLCVAVMLDRQPATNFGALFEAIFSEKQATLPALREFVPLQLARGRLCDVQVIEVPAWSFEDREDALKNLRWRFWINEGTDRASHLDELLDRHLAEVNGRWTVPGSRSYAGVVTWEGGAGARG
jgi:ubiquinone/menaquinone biosynthesis C-methylase UbiE